ncbi:MULTISPECIES: type 1 glutamine amidotransferase domain-containing protein [Kocuria]|uniref:type 1 glutamine amidotransferase domain-containing protein n=1 Tax=Kocuria TaxID=57493 RepID=UPI000BF20396|nr:MULTISPECIES: type 1 glutamine amidotransferase domain-containing protein [Kocuria]MBN6810846.1 type 1 glutamine amidotransferase domain-containing protein [Kocuria indica]MBN6842526.1 type 1 glutamine amidotransferase domain-containing protein [Kocuria indica]MCT1733907.1 type 1 glutamine amidotransferase domain-containing protein [Kocuria marina]QIR69022.1 type 1 glutamine amidotransferase domain-containing protein [Kocuria sp. KD4]
MDIETMKKILLVLTSQDTLGDTGEATGYNVAEASHPWKVFRDAGYFVDFASIAGGQPPRDEVQEDDPVQVEFTQDETVKASLYNTPRVSVVDPSQYDAVYLVGGHGTMWDFTGDADLQKLIASVYDSGGVVGAVCHGPAGLVDVELGTGVALLSGRKVAAFTNAEEKAVGKQDVVPYLLQDKLEEQGATVKLADNWEENVQVDERLVTGQNPQSAAGVAKEMTKLLTEVVREQKAEEEEAAQKLRAERDAEKAAEDDE